MTDPQDPRAGETASGEAPGGAGTARGQRRRGGLLALLVLILATVVATAGGGYWLWQRVQAAHRASELQEARWQARAQALEERLAEIAAHRHERMQTEMDTLRRELATLSQSLETLEAWAHTGGAQGLEPRTWALAQARILLLTAAYRSSAHQHRGALRALEAASARLAAVDDARLEPVRAGLAADIDSLRSAPEVDVARIDRALGELARAARELPAKTPASSAATAREAPPGEGGWRGVLDAVWRNAKELVVVRRVGENGDAAGLPPRVRVQRALEGARLAALRRDAEAFEAGLRAAREWLVAGFDSARPEVQAMVQRIEALESTALTAAPADPLQTLQLLERTLRPPAPPALPASDEMQRP